MLSCLVKGEAGYYSFSVFEFLPKPRYHSICRLCFRRRVRTGNLAEEMSGLQPTFYLLSKAVLLKDPQRNIWD
jgi:hypothetical protein